MDSITVHLIIAGLKYSSSQQSYNGERALNSMQNNLGIRLMRSFLLFQASSAVGGVFSTTYLHPANISGAPHSRLWSAEDGRFPPLISREKRGGLPRVLLNFPKGTLFNRASHIRKDLMSLVHPSLLCSMQTISNVQKLRPNSSLGHMINIQ